MYYEKRKYNVVTWTKNAVRIDHVVSITPQSRICIISILWEEKEIDVVLWINRCDLPKKPRNKTYNRRATVNRYTV